MLLCRHWQVRNYVSVKHQQRGHNSLGRRRMHRVVTPSAMTCALDKMARAATASSRSTGRGDTPWLPDRDHGETPQRLKITRRGWILARDYSKTMVILRIALR
jgi:hypothetical protein